MYTIQTSQPALKRGLFHVESWLRFPHNGLNRNDSGLYSCKAENKLGVSSSQTTVTVLYPPVPITTFSKFSANVGRSARLRFMVYSASKPRFYWSMEGNHISNSTGRYYITERGSARREIFESILIINQVSEKDFGLYTIRAENDQGRTGDTVLRLVEPGVPDPPTVLEVSATNWDTAKLLWQTGFDGGSPQSVEVLIFESDQIAEPRAPFKSLTVQLKPSPAKMLGLIGLVEDGADLSYVVEEGGLQANELNVTSLLPGQAYEVHLRGINHYGAGALSEGVARFNTPNLTEPSDVFFNPLANALQFRPADSRLCVRVAKTLDGGRTWSWLEDCLNAGRGVLNLGPWPTGAVALAVQMCLIEKQKTCTGLAPARARHFDPNSINGNRGWSPFESFEEEGAAAATLLSTPALILGIAAGIGATLILLLVSIVVVCKRRKAAMLPVREGCSKDGVYALCGGRGASGASSRGSSSSSGGMDDVSSKPVLLSAGSGGCYAAIDSVVSVHQQHSGSTSGVSGSSPLDISELISHQGYQGTTFSSMPQQSFIPQHFTQQPANGWSQSSTASGSTESAVLHVDDSGIVGEDITAMLRRICSATQQPQQLDNHSDNSGASNNVPLLSTYNQQQINACQTPDPNGQQRRIRYEVVV